MMSTKTWKAWLTMGAAIFVVSASWAWASTTNSIEALPGMEGYVSSANGSVATNSFLIAGNINTSAHGFNTVLKFGLNGVASSSIQSADLRLWFCYAAPNTFPCAYFKVQHYTFDNTSLLKGSDTSTNAVESVIFTNTVGLVQGNKYTFDVTSFVLADAAANRTDSSFRIIPTDASGNFYNPAAGYGVYFYSEYTNSWSSYPYLGSPNTAQQPLLDIVVVPEPSTVALVVLSMGMILVGRRRRGQS